MKRPPGKMQARFPELVTLREQRFAVLVARGIPAGRAHRLAGFEGTARSHRANASRLMGKANVAAEIQRLVAEQVAHLEAAGDEELELLRDLATFSVLDLYDDAGQPIKIPDLPPRVAAAIKAIRPTRYGVVLEFHDKLRPIELRLRAFGRLVDRHEVGASDSLEELLAGVAARSTAVPEP